MGDLRARLPVEEDYGSDKEPGTGRGTESEGGAGAELAVDLGLEGDEQWGRLAR